MSNRSGILRLCISGILCVLIIAYTVLNVFTQNTAPTIQASCITNDNLFIVPANGHIGIVEKVVTTNTEQPSEPVTNNNTTPESVTASADGNVLGKIIEKFITPYTANTSYNNVYLKNSTGLDISIKELLSSPIGFNIEKNNQ